jgi:hypothetical protein
MSCVRLRLLLWALHQSIPFNLCLAFSHMLLVLAFRLAKLTVPDKLWQNIIIRQPAYLPFIIFVTLRWILSCEPVQGLDKRIGMPIIYLGMRKLKNLLGQGGWAVFRHIFVLRISRRSADFVSGRLRWLYFENLPPKFLDLIMKSSRHITENIEGAPERFISRVACQFLPRTRTKQREQESPSRL